MRKILEFLKISMLKKIFNSYRQEIAIPQILEHIFLREELQENNIQIYEVFCWQMIPKLFSKRHKSVNAFKTPMTDIQTKQIPFFVEPPNPQRGKNKFFKNLKKVK